MISAKGQRNLPFKIFRTLFLCFCKYGFNFQSCHINSHYHFLPQPKSKQTSVVFSIKVTSNAVYSKYPYLDYIQLTSVYIVSSRVQFFSLAYLETERRTRHHLSTFPISSSPWLFFLVFCSFTILLPRNVSKLLRFSYTCSLSFMCFHHLLLLSSFPFGERSQEKVITSPFLSTAYIKRSFIDYFSSAPS